MAVGRVVGMLSTGDLIVPESLLDETPGTSAPSNDPARLEAILTVLREEEGSRANAWERLVARGIIPSHFDLAEFPIEDGDQVYGCAAFDLPAGSGRLQLRSPDPKQDHFSYFLDVPE